MPRIIVRLERGVLERVDRAAERKGLSRSAWIREAVQAHPSDEFPESFFSVMGTWEGEEDPDELLRVIRDGLPQRSRPRIA